MKLISIGAHTINDALNKHSIVIDIGAHEGMFTKAITDKYDCKVDAYEPSQELFEKLKWLTAGNPKVMRFCMAVMTETGTADFTDYGNFGHSGSMLERKGKMYKEGERYQVVVVSLANAVSRYKQVDLLKINCEGAEIKMLLETPTCYLRQCKQIKVSYHVGPHKGFKPPFTEEDVDKCSRRLNDIGFVSVRTGDKNPDYSYLRK